MSKRWTGVRTGGTGGAPPVGRVARNAKLAGLPIAYAGRQAAGVGKRALGRSPAEIDLEIQMRTAQHIFEVLGELKGCATKLGQILSLYELALPSDLAQPYRTALTQLQDSAPIMLPAAVHTAMAAALGPDWRRYFLDFDDRRAAAASIGQVHRATWHDGRSVAVKVMYPGGRTAVLDDLRQLRRISVLASVFAPGTDVPAVTEALCKCVAGELDYAAEARHQQVFAGAYAGDPDFVVPAVILQREDVIVSEWLTGTPVSRLIESGAPAERSRVGMLILRFIVSTWERTELLYCDPHPGNFRILPDGRLGIVDFGACVTWPEAGFEELMVDFLDAALNGGIPALDAAVRRHGIVAPGRAYDVEALAEGLAIACEPLAQPHFRLTTEWLRGRVRYVLAPRLSNVHRQVGLPAYVTPFSRAFLTGLAVLCQLETEGAIREEVAHWAPELAAVFERFDARHGQPTDLAIARQARSAAVVRLPARRLS